ncbi:MAG: hypothetical protein HFE59_08195 [Clostridiales bacterium]|nr:hypothetical protein [Clostridiales bacterium]
MSDNDYLNMLYVFNDSFDNNKKLLIKWSNELQVRCSSITGMYETDTEPEDDDYIGEYAAAVGDVEILENGIDDSVLIYNDCIEISLKCIPDKILLEDGTVLWQKK